MTLVCIVLVVATSRLSLGEEIIISSRNARQSIGDFGLSPAGYGNSSRLNLSTGNNPIDNKSGHCEVRAGDLWKYFKSQGVDSVDNIVLVLDVGKMERSSTMALESLEFSIIGATDSSGIPSGEVISFLSMDSNGDNRLVIPGYEYHNSRPEARLELPLGFDFMERFSESSTETLMVNVSYEGDMSFNPVLSIEGRRQLFSAPNMVILGSFVIFWGSVFWILKRMTLPQKPKSAGGIDSSNRLATPHKQKSAAPAA